MLWAECLCAPQNSHVEILTFKVMVLGDEALERWFGHQGRALMNVISALKRDPRERCLTPSTMWGQREKSAVCSLKEGLHQTPNLLVPWSWTSQPPELWKINFCCLYVTQSNAIFVTAAQKDWDTGVFSLLFLRFKISLFYSSSQNWRISPGSPSVCPTLPMSGFQIALEFRLGDIGSKKW